LANHGRWPTGKREAPALTPSMHIILLEPFFAGSHAAWASGYQEHSHHRIDILPLSGHHWKWRMHGGAVTLARRFLDSGAQPDLLLATDMLDVTTFLALTRHRTARVPVALYFHENQIGYPRVPPRPGHPAPARPPLRIHQLQLRPGRRRGVVQLALPPRQLSGSRCRSFWNNSPTTANRGRRRP
jgi:Domain of unknown function (DUF3524).